MLHTEEGSESTTSDQKPLSLRPPPCYRGLTEHSYRNAEVRYRAADHPQPDACLFVVSLMQQDNVSFEGLNNKYHCMIYGFWGTQRQPCLFIAHLVRQSFIPLNDEDRLLLR